MIGLDVHQKLQNKFLGQVNTPLAQVSRPDALLLLDPLLINFFALFGIAQLLNLLFEPTGYTKTTGIRKIFFSYHLFHANTVNTERISR